MNPLTTQIDIGGVWRISIFVALAVGMIAMLRRLPLYISLLWGYVVIWALFIVEYPAWYFGKLTPAFQAQAGQTLAEVLIIPMIVILEPGLVKRSIPWLVGVELLLVWFRKSGLFVAESFDMAFIALCLPFLPVQLALPSIGTILFKHCGTAQMMLAAQLFSIVVKTKRKEAWFHMSWVTAVILMVMHYHSRGPWFDMQERTQVYATMMKVWAESTATIVRGLGAGSFLWASVIVRPHSQVYYLTMHSDWLQILFEYGVIGLVLTLVFVFMAIKRSWNNKRLLAALFGACVFAITYHPLRYAPSALVVAYIFREVFSDGIFQKSKRSIFKRGRSAA